jgi:hypothetical protein
MVHPDKLLYTREKLGNAVYELVTQPGRVQERLYHAALAFAHQIDSEYLPDEEMRRTFIGIKDDLRFDEPIGAEGRILGTLQKTNDENASAIASRILNLYLDVRGLLERG